MKVKNFPVSLVIPILNEAESLPKLLQAIEAQTHHPEEIIFVDAGSTDGGVDLIKAWWDGVRWNKAQCNVLISPGSMPGAGRNVGVRAASNNWIAFIDGGINPDSEWLEQLCQGALDSKSEAVFGLCHFSAGEPFCKAICALSYGLGSMHPVIPASLFHRKVFDKVGGFPSHLRAGEDLIWMSAFHGIYGQRMVCHRAIVHYTHFPVRWKQALLKWYLSESQCVLAGVRTRQHVIYLIGLPAIYGMAFMGGGYGACLLLLYILFRGVVDPIRRSKDRPWWGPKPIAALIAVPLATALDLAKWLGITHGVGISFLKKWRCFVNR